MNKQANGNRSEWLRMIRASNEFKYMLKNTLQKTRQMIENDVVNIKVADRQNYYGDVWELLQRLACMIQFEDNSDYIELRTNNEIDKEIKENYKEWLDF